LPGLFLFDSVCRTGNAKLRCNIIIALGDLALRFPNLLEPYTGGRGGRQGRRQAAGKAGCQPCNGTACSI